jgi:ApaG protein
MSDSTTHGIRVGATAYYLPEQSDHDQRRHVFGYTIVVANNSDKPAQLVSRHWIIIDAYGRREDVEGPGVVGQTPRIAPGEAFKYQSFCPLRTTWGTMEGIYQMRHDDGQIFEVQIARFYLKVPKDVAET